MTTARRGALVVVTGTGTGIGKTHLATALATRAGRRTTAAGSAVVGAWKPVESGIGAGVTDHDMLLGASSFHVKQDLGLAYGLTAPVSPHLAARLDGTAIDLPTIVERANLLRERADLIVVELPGGLFTPLTDDALNVDLVQALAPSATLLVAPNRLGVLHDVLAATSAARDVDITAIALTSLGPPDASASTNAIELRRILGVHVHVAEIPNASSGDLAATKSVSDLLDVVWPPG